MPKCVEEPVDDGRPERLAVNLWDLDRLNPTIRQMMVTPHVDRRKEALVWVDRSRVDETAVAFTCPLLQAACICDTLREHDRRAKEQHLTRVYLCRVTAWERLPYAAMLTVIRNGKAELNPEVFQPVAVAGDDAPPKREPIKFRSMA